MPKRYVYAPVELRELGRIMRGRILRHTVPDLPELRLAAGLTAVPTNVRALRGVTQQDVTAMIRPLVPHLLPMAPDYYSRLERGLIAHPDDQVLHALAEVLHLDPRLWDSLLQCLYGSAPSGKRELLLVTAQAPPIWSEWVRAHMWIPDTDLEGGETWGGYLAVETGDLVGQTPSIARMWGRPLRNRYLDVLTVPSARETVMIGWDRTWAATAISELAAAARAHPASLRPVSSRARADPAVRALWDAYAQRPVPGDGSPPLMRHATTGVRGVLTQSTTHIEAAPGYTWTLVHWAAI